MGSVSLASKLDLINTALDKMAISGITAPPEASDYQALLQRLEGMMYEFEQARNICCRYNFTPVPDTADYHGMNYGLFEPVTSLLAYRTLMDYGLPIPPALDASTNAAVSSLSNQTHQLRETQYPRRQARGSGNTLRYNRWQRFYRKPDRVPISCDSFKLDTNEINDYSESYLDYLLPGETIASYVLFITGGIRLVSDSSTDTAISYRLEGLNPSIDNGVEQVRIQVTTSTGRIDERLINFEVLPVTSEPERFTQDTD